MSESWRPHAYQRTAIRFCIAQACAGLFLDPGLGKTSIMLAVFKILLSKGWARKMLVVAPLRPAQSTWPAEVRKWAEFSGLRLTVLHGPGRRVANIFEGDINVINPEGLSWLFSSVQGPWPWDILCVDESPQFKHTKTRRFHSIKPHLEKFARRYILTGSPAPNGLLDLFGQVYILDLGNAFTPYITRYRTAYFNQSGFGGYTWVPKPDAEERIYKRLAPLVLRMEAKDYLDLPPLIENRVEVELPPEARLAYNQMEALMITELKTGMVVAENAAAVSSKCRQIANGGIYGMVAVGSSGTGGRRVGGADRGMERIAHHVHNAKLDAVEEIIEELQGTPALVSYEFDHDLERLRGRFPQAPHIGGGVGASRFREIEAAWNAGQLPVLLAQPKSAKYGLNLQGTHGAIIRHSIGWDLDEDQQLTDRVWRQGQKFPVVKHTVVAKDTVDEVVIATLKNKDKTQRGLLDALKEYGRKR